MNEPRDPLEIELAGMQPRAASPMLRQQIASRLAEPRMRWKRVALIVGGSLAAGIAVLLAWPRTEPPGPSEEVAPGLAHGGPEARRSSEPTLADYRRAVNQSPNALEEMLNQHASLSLQKRGNAGALRAGSRFDPSFLESMGEP